MRLYREKIPAIAKDIIYSLIEEGDLESSQPDEVALDAESVLNEYLRMSQEITDRAKERLTAAKLPYSYLGRIKKSIAEERGFFFGEEGVRYIANQLLEIFMQSNNVDEIFTDDFALRNKGWTRRSGAVAATSLRAARCGTSSTGRWNERSNPSTVWSNPDPRSGQWPTFWWSLKRMRGTSCPRASTRSRRDATSPPAWAPRSMHF